MVVMILEKVPNSLRGQLTRWMIEPKTGVFVGKLSGLVRDKLWDKCKEKSRSGGVIQIWSDANEQGFSLRSEGDTSRIPINCEGLWLILKPYKQKAEDIPSA